MRVRPWAPCLGTLEGRRSDFLITPEGRVIHGQAAAYLLRETSSIRESIREFQVIQECFDSVIVKVVPEDNFSDAISEAIVSRLSRSLCRSVSRGEPYRSTCLRQTA